MTSQTETSAAASTTPAEDSPIRVERRSAVCRINLNRPARRNAINPELLAGLSEAISEAVIDPETAVIVIRGEGPTFCAGADLRYLHALATDDGDPLEFLTDVSDCFTRIERCPKPVVAAVHGHVVAGGLELALACDVVVAQTGTLIGDGHVRNGLLPAAGSSARLPRKLGEPLARWLMLTGDLIPAEALLASGFIHAIAPPDKFDEMLGDTVARLQRSAGAAQTRMKCLLNDTHDWTLDQVLVREGTTFGVHWNSTDMVTALQGFLHRPDGTDG